jgi:hypothetical protein
LPPGKEQQRRDRQKDGYHHDDHGADIELHLANHNQRLDCLHPTQIALNFAKNN